MDSRSAGKMVEPLIRYEQREYAFYHRSESENQPIQRTCAFHLDGCFTFDRSGKEKLPTMKKASRRSLRSVLSVPVLHVYMSS